MKTALHTRAFLGRSVTVGKRKYEIHPGLSFRSRLVVYERTKAGLRRVRDRRLAAAVVKEYSAQNKRPDELRAAAARKEAQRKPVKVTNEWFWRTWWRWLRRWWAKRRADRVARNAPLPPVEIRHAGELRNLMLPQSREEAARLVEIIRAKHAREDSGAPHG